MGTFPNPDTQFKPGNPGKPKGTKHLSTWIQEICNDPEFTLDNFLFNGKQFKGAPLSAIIHVGIVNALQGDDRWAKWLAKYGWGDKLDVTSGGEKLEGLVIIKDNDDTA